MKFTALLALGAATQITYAQNLSTLLQNTQQLSQLAAILQPYPDLLNTLELARNVTVFAPNNFAFQAANQSGALASIAAIQNGVPSLIEYHVLKNQTVFASAITETPLFPSTMLNSTTFTNVTGGQVVEARRTNSSNVTLVSGLKATANVVQANINFTGGVIHIIDSVLTIPANISNFASHADLSAFTGALELANLLGPLNNLKDVTVFAPSNRAFENIGSALGNLTQSQLSSILEYHVINGTLAYSSALGNTSVPTLGGKSVNITVLPGGEVYVNQALVINADNLVANGVVHVISDVLNPNGTSATPPTGTASPTVAFAGATSASLGGLTTAQIPPTTTIAALTSSVTAVGSGYTTVRTPGGTTARTTSTPSTGGAQHMATAAVAGALAVGGWAVLAAAV